MTDVNAVSLSVFQHADSTFPSGAVSFSWGLEALHDRGIVASAADLQEVVLAQIQGRWAQFDRPLLAHAHNACGNLETLIKLDRLAEAQTLCREQRLGSKHMGMAMLRVHARLGTRLSERFAERVRRGEALGHLPVVQGLLWRACGFSEENAIAMSAHGLCTGLLGAAVRLSIVGPMQAQIIHAALVPVLSRAMQSPVSAPDELNSFVPQIEIASMLHETDDLRLFMN